MSVAIRPEKDHTPNLGCDDTETTFGETKIYFLLLKIMSSKFNMDCCCYIVARNR